MTRRPQPAVRASLLRAGAFTVLELLVGLAIIAILAVILTPAYSRIVEGGRATACIGHLRQLGIALNAYLADNDMTMPTMAAGRASRDEDTTVIDNTLDKYVADRAVFACPSDRHYAAVSGTSYFWNVALNGQPLSNLNFLHVVEEHSRIPILSDKDGKFHPYLEHRVNVLYADGHASKNLSFVAGKE